jgi:hypothetical protein
MWAVWSVRWISLLYINASRAFGSDDEVSASLFVGITFLRKLMHEKQKWFGALVHRSSSKAVARVTVALKRRSGGALDDVQRFERQG